MKRFPFLHLLLFVTTFISMLAAGALWSGVDLLAHPGRIFEGFPFAGTLIIILLVHELAHYRAARRHGTKATLPYFIPLPVGFGTLGAFIKMKSPITTRKALVDIGASGPIAGFIVSVIACTVGLYLSQVITVEKTDSMFSLGDSLLFKILALVVFGVLPEHTDILLHPIAFAGWIGLFVTSLNLIPVGQLDGGHIAFAFLGEKHRRLSGILLVALCIMAIFFWPGWAVWAGLMYLLGIKHPPVLYWEETLDKERKIMGIVSLVIFIITFIPAPFSITF
ncbi:MAG TPA: site-2 protease family protein [Dissulfurispiraceae bacterium]|nr:site-2 protease family protein [Dissulfurispiraceae bacterium]